MKLENKNPNYCASIVRIHNLVKFDGLNNLLGFPCFGNMSLVTKDHTIGELGVLFTAETELSDDFCRENNLYRNAELNKDKDKTGYMDKNRVKPLKIRGHISTALFLPLSSLSYLGIDVNELKEGDTFTHVNGIQVCKKYIIFQKTSKKNKQRGQTKNHSVDENVFKRHIETEFFLRNLDHFSDNDWIIVTEKIHSVSARFGNVKIDRKLKWYEKALKYIGVKIDDKEYRCIAGSRKVVKIEDSSQSFYENDIWNNELLKIQHLIPKDVLIFGEIVGWDGDKPLQKDYTYQIPKGQTKLYVYRIATVNENGFMVDWSWEQIKLFCKNNGLSYVPEIYQGFFKDFDYTVYEDKKFNEELGLTQCLPLDKESPCSEGIVVRLENGLIPYLTKFKSPQFYLHEGNEITAGRPDIESQESLDNEK